MFHIYSFENSFNQIYNLYTNYKKKKVKFETKNSNLFGFFHEFASLPCCSTKHSKLGMKMKFNPQKHGICQIYFLLFSFRKIIFLETCFPT